METKRDISKGHVYNGKPHRPPSAYQPNLFPLNPTEGNPWAHIDSNVPYVSHQNEMSDHERDYHNLRHSYGRSDYDRSYSRVNGAGQPYSGGHYDESYDNYYTRNQRSSYNQRLNSQKESRRHSENEAHHESSYNGKRHEPYFNGSKQQRHKERTSEPSKNYVNDTNTDIATNNSMEPETSAQIKIKELGPKVSPPIIKALHTGQPNGKRLLLRFIQFLASIAAFCFIVGAPGYSGQDTPFGDKSGVIVLYILSMLSSLVSLYFLINYCTRRFKHGEKLRRWILLGVDMFFAISWGADVVILVDKFKCSPGGYNHWCDFYNTSIFFSVVAFASYTISFFWDIVGSFSKKSQMNYAA
ncbi:hypothetical protein G9A89_006558 [Geosiphon pyriformis]|nr:hypothetical protein G9A89_006558 [Geosiphon pyriformis]